MEVNKVNRKTSFTSFYITTGNGFKNLARKGNPVSIDAFVKNIGKNVRKDNSLFKSFDIHADDTKIQVALTDKEATEFSKLKYIEDKLEFFNKYLKTIDIKKENIKLGDTKAFDTYILS